MWGERDSTLGKSCPSVKLSDTNPVNIAWDGIGSFMVRERRLTAWVRAAHVIRIHPFHLSLAYNQPKINYFWVSFLYTGSVEIKWKCQLLTTVPQSDSGKRRWNDFHAYNYIQLITGLKEVNDLAAETMQEFREVYEMFQIHKFLIESARFWKDMPFIIHYIYIYLYLDFSYTIIIKFFIYVTNHRLHFQIY
jgi:hypothetical protein